MKKNMNQSIHHGTQLFVFILMIFILINTFSFLFISPIRAMDPPELIEPDPIPVENPPAEIVVLLGDVSGDEIVDFNDITPITYAMEHTEAEFDEMYPDGCYWAGDMNQDGVVDQQDVNPFVDLLLGQPPEQNNDPPPESETQVIPDPPSGSPSSNSVPQNNIQNVPTIIPPAATLIAEPSTNELIPQHITIPIYSDQTNQVTQITTIELNNKKYMSTPQITIIQTSEKPEELPPPSLGSTQKQIGTYYTILLTGNDISSELNDMTVTIVVDKTMIGDNIDLESLQILGFFENKPLAQWQSPFVNEITQSTSSGWKTLTADKVSENPYTATYHVKTTQSLATFTIIGLEKIEVPYQSAMPEIPWVAIMGVIISASTLLGVIIVKGGYIYREEEQISVHPQKKSRQGFPTSWKNLPGEMKKLRSHAIALKIFLNFMLTRI